MFVGKVLFCFYLLYIFLEEGCVKYMLDEVYIIVSLDGSCINLVMCQIEIVVEIKCLFFLEIGLYKLFVYYKIFKYYIF